LIQQNFSQRQSKSKLRLEKLERAYTLCQLIYDGYRKALLQAETLWRQNPQSYAAARTHPATEMSEFKMLTRCYFPFLESDLLRVDVHHQKIKELGRTLESAATGRIGLDTEQHTRLLQDFHDAVVSVGPAMDSLRQAIALNARDYTK
jgi:hypothetical protein